KSGHSIATCLYKAECVVRARRRWHLRQITDEIEPSERGRHVLAARRNSERETRKPRCAKPSAPKRSRRRMKPILHWKKSKAEALFAVQADGLRSAIHISNHHRRYGGHHGEGSDAQQQRKEEAEAGQEQEERRRSVRHAQPGQTRHFVHEPIRQEALVGDHRGAPTIAPI